MTKPEDKRLIRCIQSFKSLAYISMIFDMNIYNIMMTRIMMIHV